MTETVKKKVPHVVVQIEVVLSLGEGERIKETIERTLEEARGYGAARVVGSYETEDDPMNDPEWVARAQSGITISSPVFIEVD